MSKHDYAIGILSELVMEKERWYEKIKTTLSNGNSIPAIEKNIAELNSAIEVLRKA